PPVAQGRTVAAGPGAVGVPGPVCPGLRKSLRPLAALRDEKFPRALSRKRRIPPGRTTSMPFLQTDWDPSRRQLRQFAWVAALALGWASMNQLSPTTGLTLRLAAGLLFALGTIW